MSKLLSCFLVLALVVMVDQTEGWRRRRRRRASEALPVAEAMSIQLAKTATTPSPSLITEWLKSSPSDSRVSQPARSTAQQATQSQLSLSSVDQLVVTGSTVPSPRPSPSSSSRVLQSDIFTSSIKPASASPSPSPSLSVHPPDFTSLATLSANPSPPLRVVSIIPSETSITVSASTIFARDVHGDWSNWSNWTECSATCGVGVRSREQHCDNPVPAYSGRPCEGIYKDKKSCSTGEVCVAGVAIGWYNSFPSDQLGNFTDEIQWSRLFSSQMHKIVKECAQLAAKRRKRFFAVEDFGNCHEARVFSSGSESKGTRCIFDVGVKNQYYVYELSL